MSESTSEAVSGAGAPPGDPRGPVSRMRIAWWSPLPPARSGIADYSAELLPEVARHLDVELIVDEGARVAPELAERFAIHPPRALGGLLASGRCATVVYHLGNNRDFHAAIYRALLEHPGVVVLHEAVVHHLVRDLTLHAGDPQAYVRELRYAYGASGEALGRRCVATGVPLDPWSYPLFERIVDRSLGCIVHNEYTRRRVLASRPLARLAVVPHHLSLGSGATDPAAARAALGLPEDGFLIGSFGFVTAAKRAGVLLAAFARLRRERPAARLLLVGEISPHYDFASVIRRLRGEGAGGLAGGGDADDSGGARGGGGARGPGGTRGSGGAKNSGGARGGGGPGEEALPGVTVTGRLELERFLLYMAAVDLAVNLRYPSAGETSGTLIRLLGLGKPAIVSKTGAFAELPPDCCAQVEVDEGEEELLYRFMLRLADDEALRRRMGDNARRHIAERHTLAGSAAAYAGFVRDVVRAGAQPFRALPPLAPYGEDDLAVELLREVSAELSDLGIAEDDDEALGAVAAAVVELGIERTPP
jgi:glycosyltransferase involved in cell wall biosynthesis